MRASTGTVSTDVHASPTSYYGYDEYRSPKVAERIPDYRSGYPSRRLPDRKLEAQPISSSSYRDANQSLKLRTEYAVRPRSHTTSEHSRRPLSVIIPSSNRQTPMISSGYERSTSPLPPRSSYTREDPERYITAASSTSSRPHRRVYNSEYTSDSGRLDPGDRARVYRDRSYRIYRPGGYSAHPAYGDPRNWDDSEYYDAYSYTNPREQFEKDSAARSSQPATRRAGRPSSVAGAEAFMVPSAHHRESRGPPPSHRGFDKLQEEDRLRLSPGRGRADSDATRETHRHSRLRVPVSLHQVDDGYSSYTDDHKDSRRHRRHHRDSSSSRPHRDHRGSRKHGAEDLLAPVLGGLATLGLASGYSDDGREADRSARSEKHRAHGVDHGREREDGYDARDKVKGSTVEEKDGSHHRRRERSKRHDESDGFSGSDDDVRTKRRERSSRPYHDSGSSDGSPNTRSRDLADKSRVPRKTDVLEPAALRSLDEDGEDRPRKPMTVEPASTKEPEAPPKSILKAPREKFPEDDNPIREGVAPLKDAHQQGIPPGARWTKIDRRLVNPAALEVGKERFEERPDYVIVLRVLTKEEIQAYAVKTQEIRGRAPHSPQLESSRSIACTDTTARRSP